MALPLYVVFTMDCERIAAESSFTGGGGPETWELSERAIRGFCQILLDKGIAPTLFLIPECAQRHNQILRAFGSQGVDLGMHMHPQSFGNHQYSQYLGHYSGELQEEIIRHGMDVIIEALGGRPTSFRLGNCSANDETFPILSKLGFRQGSVSDPGRDKPEYAAVWKDAYPYVHRANAKNKLIPGDLPFVEIPVTTNPHRHHCITAMGSGFPYELRIESGTFGIGIYRLSTGYSNVCYRTTWNSAPFAYLHTTSLTTLILIASTLRP